jgi:hypothetical protein
MLRPVSHCRYSGLKGVRDKRGVTVIVPAAGGRLFSLFSVHVSGKVFLSVARKESLSHEKRKIVKTVTQNLPRAPWRRGEDLSANANRSKRQGFWSLLNGRIQCLMYIFSISAVLRGRRGKPRVKLKLKPRASRQGKELLRPIRVLGERSIQPRTVISGSICSPFAFSGRRRGARKSHPRGQRAVPQKKRAAKARHRLRSRLLRKWLQRRPHPWLPPIPKARRPTQKPTRKLRRRRKYGGRHGRGAGRSWPRA